MSVLGYRLSHPRDQMTGVAVLSTYTDRQLWDKLYNFDDEVFDLLWEVFQEIDNNKEYEVLFQTPTDAPGLKFIIHYRPDFATKAKILPAGKLMGSGMLIRPGASGGILAMYKFSSMREFIDSANRTDFYLLFAFMAALVLTAELPGLYPRIGCRPDWLTIEMVSHRNQMLPLTASSSLEAASSAPPRPAFIQLSSVVLDAKKGGYTLPVLKKIAQAVCVSRPGLRISGLRTRKDFISFIYQHEVIASRLTMDQVLGNVPISTSDDLFPSNDELDKNISIEEVIRDGHIHIVKRRASTVAKCNQSLKVLDDWLHLATKHDQPEIVDYLLQAGASCHRSGLNAAALAGNLDIVKVLSRYLHDYNSAVLLVLEYLYHDAQLVEARRQCVFFLASVGGGINYNKALEIVSSLGDLQMVKWFIAKGATALGRALELAEKEGHQHVIDVLRAQMGN